MSDFYVITATIGTSTLKNGKKDQIYILYIHIYTYKYCKHTVYIYCKFV
jgi:hypothetical protein